MVCEKDKMKTSARGRARDLLLSIMIGTAIGFAVLGAMVLPHDWKPMGRLSTFYVFGMALGVVHACICVIIFIPVSFWAERISRQQNLIQVFSFGALLYGAHGDS